MTSKNKVVENEADLLKDHKSRVSLNTLRHIGYDIKHTYPDNISIATLKRQDKKSTLPTTIEIIDETKIEWKTWKNQDDKMHRENGPAVIYYQNDSIINKEWFLNNKNYSGFDNKPSCLEFYDDYMLKKIMWTNKDGFFHAFAHPAYLYYDRENNINKLMWYTNGNPTRDLECLHLPTVLYIQNNNIVDFEYYLDGINKTTVIKNWMLQNEFSMNSINKELFYINFVN